MGSSKTGTSDGFVTESDGVLTKSESDMDGENDAASPPSLDSCPYSEGETVLAYHNLRIYEAKVRKVEYRSREWMFYVHYTGWNKNWDEWVGMDRLMKFTEENVQRQEALNKKQGMDKSTKPGRGSYTKPKSSNGPRGKRRKNDIAVKGKKAINVEKLVNIQLPPTLKKQLVDDCEFITHLGKLVKLPRTPNVDEIFKKYLDYRLKKDELKGDSVEEILKGLRCYFDKALPAMLLYRSERQQYEEAITDDISPSTVYGAEHLLRLFVKLPELLFHANIEEETLTELHQKLIDFLKFLQKNQSEFFLSTYHVREDIETNTGKQED